VTGATDLLARLDAAEEVGIVTLRADGTSRGPVVLWVVRVGDAAYVRSVKAAEGAWFRHATAIPAGAVEVDGDRVDVDFVPVPVTEGALHEGIDAAYRAKYARYPADLAPMLTDAVVATTLRLDVRPPRPLP
jgi:hypothetical protein